MSMQGRRRGDPLLARGTGRQVSDIVALLARGHTPLEANWRIRIRGHARAPMRPVGVPSIAPSLDAEVEPAGADRPERTNGAGHPLTLPGGNKTPGDDKIGVLEFPEVVLPPPEEPARGPLSWAYWSARRRA